MNNIFLRGLTTIIIATIVGTIANLASPNRIEWFGFWPNVLDSDSVWLSPSYEEGDPPAIHLGAAFDRYLSRSYLFVDSREPEEYETWHIVGAISLPFDDIDEYWPQVEPLMPVDTPIVIYCSGSECESSLYLARYMVEDLGYQNVEIFFGGWRAWYNERLPIEGKYGYDNSDE
ncbi:MAG: rhodanese-like domain-containing protein [candidate division Zixibacteria bacterium]|nr:rhodanese-like domain-containing protein [candidate division Zixibacteria bacterium]